MLQTFTYQNLRQAVVEMKPVKCRFGGYYREICFHVLGDGKDGYPQALGFQFAGDTSDGPIKPEGNWRCMPVAEIQFIEMLDGPWRTGDSHKRRQTCVKRVDVEVPWKD